MASTGGAHAHDAHISGSTTAALVRYVERLVGAPGVVELIQRSGDQRPLEMITDVAGWSSYAETCALFEAARVVTGDRDVGFRIGEEMLRQHRGTEVAALLRSLGSPGELLRNIAATGAKYSTVTEFEAVDVGAEAATITTKTAAGFTRHELICDYVAGLLSQASALFGMDAASVDERECQRRGAPRCVYDVRWDPATAAAPDPVRRVEHLEAQLAAMTERLEAFQATATEMVAATDVETLLARIARRAGLAVRAPAHILAVRLPGEDQLRVHVEGIAPTDRDRLVTEILGSDLADQADRLVVDVASARHHYGRLAAVYAGQSSFFVEERRLLGAYAAQAAVALDTATALRELTRRNDTARDLLRLSSELAQVATRDEVAARLVSAVPMVVDCDSAMAFLWDDAAEHLTVRASFGLRDEAEQFFKGVAITRAETPMLQGDLAARRPFFLDASHPDHLARALLEVSGSTVAAVVPIAAAGEFFGIVTAGVYHGSDRLRSTDDVLERLAGLAAQASSALRNACLLEEVSHQALHDPLTGLPNRSLLRDRLGHALTSARRSGARVGVLFIDLDGFKQVNDTYGHATGDALIVAVADRLRSSLRSGDTVARIGGDEFAVVLPEIADEVSCEAVARKLLNALRHPLFVERHEFSLTASIGAVAGSSDDTYDSLVNRSDVAMYAAKQRGRNGYVVSAVDGTAPDAAA